MGRSHCRLSRESVGIRERAEKERQTTVDERCLSLSSLSGKPFSWDFNSARPLYNRFGRDCNWER